MLNYQALSQMFRNLRLNRGFRQEDVANALYISRSTYSNIEEGKIRPSVEVLLELSKIFDIPPEAFLYPEGCKQITTEGKRVQRKWKEEIDFVDGLQPKEQTLIALLRNSDMPDLYSQIFDIARKYLQENEENNRNQ